MGLSCVVASGVDTPTVTAAWGCYGKAEVLDDAGAPRRDERELERLPRGAISQRRRFSSRERRSGGAGKRGPRS